MQWGRVGPVRAEWGRVGRMVRAEWGWGGVGHALEFNSITLRLGLGYAWGRFGPTGAEQSQVGPSKRVGPVRAEWGWGGVGHALGFPFFALRVGLSGVGEGLGMPCDSFK